MREDVEKYLTRRFHNTVKTQAKKHVDVLMTLEEYLLLYTGSHLATLEKQIDEFRIARTQRGPKGYVMTWKNQADRMKGYMRADMMKITRREVSIIEGRCMPVGSTHTQESKDKMSDSKKGKPLAAEHCANISAGLKGRTHSEYTKQKMSETRKGKKHEKQHCENISKALTGRTLSEETKQKMRIAALNRKNKDANK